MQLHDGLEPLPDKLKHLPIDERGYPVPWFVDWVDGKPEFRAMDGRKFRDAIKKRLCWVCGDRLGINLAFLAGPMCGINRTSAEPPSHYICAAWSARNCPFLNNPHAVGVPSAGILASPWSGSAAPTRSGTMAVAVR